MALLDLSQGRWAVSYARSVVESTVEDVDVEGPVGNGISTDVRSHVSSGSETDSSQMDQRPSDVDPVFQTERGAFVTLEKDGELRGCIGRPRAVQPAIVALREAARGAATDDPRFPPVAPTELEAITVEVSVLTPPSPIDTEDPGEYPEAISVGRDGLIVHQNGRSGLLLPQVPVDQGWDPTEFLDATCRKAGLRPSTWRDSGVSVEQFQAQIFAEQEPRGPIDRVEPRMGVDG